MGDVKALLAGPLLVHVGDKVEERDGPSHLAGKYVLVYFSAHWCPPCRAFTPKLKELYRRLVAQGKAVEVVFISSDNSLPEFNDYFGEMPWAAVPYAAGSRRSSLARAFGVAGIPALGMVTPEGQVQSRNIRSAVLGDLNGEKFPWAGMEDTGGGGLNFQTILFALVLLYWVYTLVFPKK